MDVKLLSKTEEKMSFLLKDSTPIIANTLRRYIVEHVPTLAIEEVEFKKNNSLLYDTMIAHRLGLIPIKTDLKSYNLPKIVSGKEIRDATSQVEFSLESSSVGMVYSGKLKFKDPAVKPMSDNFPIVKLLKGQSLEFEATAVLGQGKDHMKFAPGIAWYRYDLEEDDVKKGAGKADPSEKGALPDPEQSDFVFFVEPFGQLSPKQMVTEALDILEKKYDEFAEKLSA